MPKSCRAAATQSASRVSLLQPERAHPREALLDLGRGDFTGPLEPGEIPGEVGGLEHVEAQEQQAIVLAVGLLEAVPAAVAAALSRDRVKADQLRALLQRVVELEPGQVRRPGQERLGARLRGRELTLVERSHRRPYRSTASRRRANRS